MNTVKITQVEAIPILVPLTSGLTTKTAHGEHIDSPYVIIRVHTDAGITGVGEATLAPRWSGETSPGCVAVVRDLLDPALRGSDALDVNACRGLIEGALRLNPFTKAAVEMAIWDIAGKAAGQPVCRLLGGRLRDELPMKMVVGAFPVDRAVALAQRFLDGGAHHLKVKVGLDPEEDVARVTAVRELAGPDIGLSIDGNCGWSVSVACRTLPRLEAFDVRLAEQPIRAHDVADWSRLRASTSIPLMADESIFSLADAWQLVSHRAVDVLAIYPGKHGGLLGAMEIAHLARAAGIVCSMGSNLELGIGTAAMLHLGAAAEAIDNETYPGDYLGPLYHEADMITDSLRLGPVTARVPDGPGLGVDLDQDQLERWRDA